MASKKKATKKITTPKGAKKRAKKAAAKAPSAAVKTRSTKPPPEPPPEPPVPDIKLGDIVADLKDPGPSEAEMRQRAREERHRAEKDRKIQKARERKNALLKEQARAAQAAQAAQQPPVAPPQPPPPSPVAASHAAQNHQPVALPLAELHKYKLAVMNQNYEAAVNKVKAPIVQAVNQMLQQKIDQAVEADPDCQTARRAQVECINEIIEATGPGLPAGYAVTQIQLEQSAVRCEYAPQQVGKKLPL